MREYIERIIDNGDIEKMHELSEMLEELLCEVTDEDLKKTMNWNCMKWLMAES